MVYNEVVLGIPLKNLCDITTWKKQQIKILGNEDLFNQEYDLKFTDSSRSLLTEQSMSLLNRDKVQYQHIVFPELSKLRWSAKNLTFHPDLSVFDPRDTKKYHIILTVDVSEGLGQDYSVINIFKIAQKSIDYIKNNPINLVGDAFSLTQIGIFRSNLVSVQMLAEILYIIAFEIFDEDKVKIALEINTYGSELVAHMPRVFDEDNNYGSHVFLKYKHRIDSEEKKIGIKVSGNKNLLIKTFQDYFLEERFSINNFETVHELGTFIKTTTNKGTVVYKGDGTHDDIVMTCIHAASVFKEHFFNSICEEILPQLPEELRYIISEKERKAAAAVVSPYDNLTDLIRRPNYYTNNGGGYQF
jgi:hypothetical protein